MKERYSKKINHLSKRETDVKDTQNVSYNKILRLAWSDCLANLSAILLKYATIERKPNAKFVGHTLFVAGVISIYLVL